MKVGQVLRKRRKLYGMRLEDVAVSAEISIAYLSDIERDKASPTLETLARVAQALRTKASEILREAEEAV